MRLSVCVSTRVDSPYVRVGLGVVLGLTVAVAGGAAQDQPAPSAPVLSGTLIRLWGDPVPGVSGGPRAHLEIVRDDGRPATQVILPDAIADRHGGVESLVGQIVSVEVATASALATVGQPAPPPTVTSLAVIEERPLPYAPSEGLQPWVIVPCRYADNASSPASQPYLQSLIGEGPSSLGEYWHEVSYGTVRISGRSLDWRTMARPHGEYFTDLTGDGAADVNFTLLRDDCLDTADSDIDFASVAGVVLVFNGPVGCCAWGGAGLVTRDGVSRSIGVTWLPVGFGTTHNVMAHEMGHAFGLGHLRDTGTTGPRWDIMASGATCTPPSPFGCRAVHLSAAHKDQLGWIPTDRRFSPSAGVSETIFLESLALPPSEGAYLAAVVPAGAEDLVIESRWRRGYDAGVPGDAVVMYRADPSKFDRTSIVDADGNGDRNDAGSMWLPGESFTDPATAINVRVDAVSAAGHVVTITRPAATPPIHTSCLTARPVTTLPFNETVRMEGLPDQRDLPFAACAPVPARSLWYRVTAPATGLLFASVAKSPGATATFWLGTCGRLGANRPSRCDGAPGTAPAATDTVLVVAGEQVHLVVTVPGREPATAALTLSFQSSPRATCTTAVTPTPATLPVQGGPLTFAVEAPAGCSWNLAESVGWLTPVGTTFGTGSRSTAFTVSANAGPGRAYGFWVDNRYVVVTQDGCSIGDDDCDGLPTAWERAVGLDPASAVGPDGGSGDPDGDGITNAAELAQQSHPVGTFSRYFAEGATGAFFNVRFALANPGQQPVRALLRFLVSHGVAASLPVTLAPRQRLTVNPETLPGLASAEFATVLEADGIVVADRQMQWGGVGYGSHAETAILEPSRTWYLAEGSTVGPFALFYLLQNPSTTDAASVRVRYLLPGGAPLEKLYHVPPSSRFNIWVDEEWFGEAGQALASTDVSAALEVIEGPAIIVERAMYLTRPGEVFGAGHESAGVTAPSTTWFLAEGATGAYFDEFVLIANPNATAADVDVQYLLPDGTVHAVRHHVPAAARYNIWIDHEEVPGLGRVLADTAVSVALRSVNDVPIVVERAMWWPGASDTWMEAHNSAGATASGTRWALAEGEVGGPGDVDTYVLVANVSPRTGSLRVTLLFEDATTIDRQFAVPGQSRFNVWVRDAFPEARGRRFAVLVESLGDEPAQLVVERAMYSNALGVPWAAGTHALGVRLSP